MEHFGDILFQLMKHGANTLHVAFIFLLSLSMFHYLSLSHWIFPLPAASPKIIDLSDQHIDQGHGVLCVTEGVPTPTVHWYSCESIGK